MVILLVKVAITTKPLPHIVSSQLEHQANEITAGFDGDGATREFETPPGGARVQRRDEVELGRAQAQGRVEEVAGSGSGGGGGGAASASWLPARVKAAVLMGGEGDY